MTKTLDIYFSEWFTDIFDDEWADEVIPVLYKFFVHCNQDFDMVTLHNNKFYEYDLLIKKITPAESFFLIKILREVYLIDEHNSFGGWLTPIGITLCDFVLSKTTDQLIKYVEDYVESDMSKWCYRDICQCSPENSPCHNPFYGVDPYKAMRENKN